MTNKPIVVRTGEESTYQVLIAPLAIIERDNLLAESSKLNREIEDHDQQRVVVATAAKLKGYAQECENLRVEIKAPFLAAERAIDAKAKEFSKTITAEVDRLEKMLSAFQRKERDRINRELEEARAAQRRAEQEAAEAQRRLAEAAKKQQDTTQAEIDAQMAAEEQAEAEREAETVATVAEATPVTGAKTRASVFKYEVTNIEALYLWDLKRREEARKKGRTLPSFVKLEVNKRDFKSFINIIGDDERASIPGVVITEDTSVSVNAVSPTLTIQ